MQGQINTIGGIGTMVGQYAGQQRGMEFARQLFGVSGMTPTNNSASGYDNPAYEALVQQLAGNN
jgi:hypothetical protein